MSNLNFKYSLAKEAFKSFLIGCTLSLLTGVTVLLFYSLFSFNIVQNLSFFIRNAEAWDPWLAEFDRN